MNHAFVYSNAYPNAVWSHMTLTDDQRVAIVAAATATGTTR